MFSKPDQRIGACTNRILCDGVSEGPLYTPAVECAYDTVSVPAPPISVLLPLLPSSVSSNDEPVRFSNPEIVS